MKDDKRSVKIGLEPGETCWGTLLTKGDAKQLIVQIDNVPFSGKYNFGDVVEASLENGFLVAGRIIHSRYDSRCELGYDEEYQFHRLASIFRILGCQIEGGVGPDKKSKSRGFMCVAYNKEYVDPVKIAEGMRISQGKSG